ncbi:MAG: IS66 family insertion sequence element accessory protein TnpB [Deltaproteobacteria bacterium]|nr:IS66 family insertion sequence element accessory protein TnpB [Deltaproteobacteria bacterium]
MLLVPRSTKIYMGRSPVNMGKSFDGLSNEVRAVLRKDPLSGHIFIFFNRRRTMAKMIVWTRGGYTIVAKRLERGRFAIPEATDAACASWTSTNSSFSSKASGGIEVDSRRGGSLLSTVDTMQNYRNLRCACRSNVIQVLYPFRRLASL